MERVKIKSEKKKGKLMEHNIDTEDEIICPHCDYEYSDESNESFLRNYGDSGATTMKCPNCNNKFQAELYLFSSYVTYKMDEERKEHP